MSPSSRNARDAAQSRLRCCAGYHRDQAKVLSKRHRDAAELKEVKRLNKNASLVLTYGKYAVVALAARGVGPDTAARILSRYNKLELK